LDLTIWLPLCVAITAFLALDFLVFGRRGVTFRGSALWSAGWLALGVGFTGVVWALDGGEAGGEYLAGYLIERSLSIDNVFVFALIFGHFAVPFDQQGRLLAVGIVMALVLRAGFIAAGAALLDAFHLTVYVFGLILVVTGIRLARHGTPEIHPERSRVLRALRAVWPGAPVAAAVILMIAVTDVVFAIDSIPAIFAVTDETFVVFAANAFALLGLRSLYFLLAGMMERFVYLSVGLAAILVLIGAKMLLADVWHPPIWMPLLAIIVILAVAVTASLRRAPAPAESAT
jgi:tellurite resistance protein TerC